MSRVIKFRAWDKKCKKMIDWKRIYIQYHATSLLFRQDTFELLQYTGLEDYEGTEIYEGDIVDNDGEIGKVLFEDGAFLVEYNKPCCREFLLDCNEAAKVIGNIYENPELFGKAE